jgi:hypothetical protein
MSHHHHDRDRHHDHHHHHHFRFLPRDPRLRLVVLILLATSIIYGTIRYVFLRTDHSRDRKKIERVELEPETMMLDGGENMSLEDDSEDTTPTQLGILDRPLDVFNFSNLNMAGLSTILNEEGLELIYPPASKSLSLTVQEAGGRPLGEILAQMLSPHSYAFIRQDNRVQIVEASPYVVAREEQEEDTVPPCHMKTVFNVNPESPFELWIDSNPAVHLKLRIDPLYGGEATEESGNTIRQVCTVVARRGYHRVFRQILNTRIDRMASIQIQMAQDSLQAQTDEILLLTLKPLKCNKEGVTMELGFENKASE